MMGQKLQELETFFHLGKMNTEEFAAARKETFNIKLIITVGAKTGQNRVNRPRSENHSTHRLALQASHALKAGQTALISIKTSCSHLARVQY
jgi:hypothetical protein